MGHVWMRAGLQLQDPSVGIRVGPKSTWYISSLASQFRLHVRGEAGNKANCGTVTRKFNDKCCSARCHKAAASHYSIRPSALV